MINAKIFSAAAVFIFFSSSTQAPGQDEDFGNWLIRVEKKGRRNSSELFARRIFEVLSLAGFTVLFLCPSLTQAQTAAFVPIASIETDSSGGAAATVLVATTNKEASPTREDPVGEDRAREDQAREDQTREDQARENQARGVKIGKDGAFKFSLLPPVDDRVKLTAAGFKSPDIETVTANITQPVSLNQVQAPEPAPTAPPNLDALTWHGITFYGAYDVGAGWVSHGLPQSPYNYEGSSLVNRNANSSRFLVEPDNLSQTSLGLRGKINFAPGWSVVFNASTGIDPQSGQLANASATDIEDNGLPRSGYSEAIDGARAGQPLNDEYYGGIASEKFGSLTFGRQRSLGTDTMLLFDPASGAYAFSYIGYNGTMAGGGDTENTRWDNAVKYRLTYGSVHFGAMGKFADGTGGCYAAAAVSGANWAAATATTASGTIPGCTPEQAHNTAYGFNVGAGFRKVSGDVVYQRYNDAISVVNPLLGPQSLSSAGQYQSTTDSIDTTPITGANVISTTNTVYGIVTDNRAILGAVKYTGEQFKFFGGYEFIRQSNPDNPLGVGATDQGGYLMSGVEDNNLDSTKLVQIWWTGAKYSYDKKTDITLSFYEQVQNTFRVPATCAPGNMRSSCAGTLNEASLYTDHHFTKRFDGFAGLAYSFVTGGLAIAIPHGPGVPYLHNSNFAPTVGGRFTF